MIDCSRNDILKGWSRAMARFPMGPRIPPALHDFITASFSFA